MGGGADAPGPDGDRGGAVSSHWGALGAGAGRAGPAGLSRLGPGKRFGTVLITGVGIESERP